MIEIWKTIGGFSKYEVSNFGNVRNVKTGKSINKSIHHTGYEYIFITNDDGIAKSLLVHRLVADAFLLKDDSREVIDHINNIKTDNRVFNLQRLSNAENMMKYYQDVATGILPKREYKQYSNELVIDLIEYLNNGGILKKFAEDNGIKYKSAQSLRRSKRFQILSNTVMN